MPSNGVGKEAEAKIKQWLNRPEEGYSFDRLPDQMTGLLGSTNICDFICFKSPNMYYIESKSVSGDRFDFSLISWNQRKGLLEKSKIANCYGWIILLFASHKRAFRLDIRDIVKLEEEGVKSINIKKIDTWNLPYIEINTIPNNRKKLLDYTGEIEDLIGG